MINALGTLSLIWLMLWLALTLTMRLLYPMVRPYLLRLHPRHGNAILLLFWSAPFVLSLATSVLLFVPSVDGVLVNPHCHGDCSEHVPMLDAGALVWLGLVLAAIAAAGLIGHLSQGLLRGARMRRQFDALSVRQPGYRLLDSLEPVVFTLGWWRPRVFISRGLLAQCSSGEVNIILEHEEAHRRRRDNLRLLLIRVFCMFLPYRLRDRVLHDMQLLCEQSCDFVAADHHGSVSVAETLVHVGRILRRAAVPAPGSAFDGSDLHDRVHALLGLESRKLLSAWQITALSLAVVASMLLAVEPLHHGAEWLIGVLEHNLMGGMA